jgi:hypothetical protein
MSFSNAIQGTFVIRRIRQHRRLLCTLKTKHDKSNNQASPKDESCAISGTEIQSFKLHFKSILLALREIHAPTDDILHIEPPFAHRERD